MAEFKYAKGRIAESLQFIMGELKEFEQDYAAKDWTEYRNDNKLQKNRLAHRYLNFRWEAMCMFKEQRQVIGRILERIMDREEKPGA